MNPELPLTEPPLPPPSAVRKRRTEHIILSKRHYPFARSPRRAAQVPCTNVVHRETAQPAAQAAVRGA